MINTVFFKPVSYIKTMPTGSFYTLRDLCKKVGVKCQASGKWTERKIQIVQAEQFQLYAEPGDWGKVRIEAPIKPSKQQARFALIALAYGLHDLVAKQSIKGIAWSKLRPPRGRPKKKKRLSSKERQRRFRAKIKSRKI